MDTVDVTTPDGAVAGLIEAVEGDVLMGVRYQMSDAVAASVDRVLWVKLWEAIRELGDGGVYWP